MALPIIALFAAATLAQPDPTPSPAPAPPASKTKTVASGKVVLPVTGLAVDLPKIKVKGATWVLTSSWSLSDEGKSFDGRDVVDLRIGKDLVAGNWFHVGYFSAGACDKVVTEIAVPDRWTSSGSAWGQSWQFAGGTYELETLGKVPAIAGCIQRPGDLQLLVYHFFLDQKPGAPQDQLVESFGKDPLVERVTAAFIARSHGSVQPTKVPEVRRRGDIEASRTVKLEKSRLEVKLPDDGFVWLTPVPSADATSDMLDRMAPSTPDLTIEVARFPDGTCDEMKGLLIDGSDKVKSESPPKNVPATWSALGTVVLDQNLERVLCHQFGADALLVGLISAPDVPADFGPFAPLVDAITAAATP